MLSFGIVDSANDLKWTWEEFINLTVVDTCSEHLKLQTDFPAAQEKVYLSETYIYTMTVDNSNQAKCPIDLKLKVECDSCEQLLMISEINDEGSTTYELSVEALSEAQLGAHIIDVVAIDENTGFSTQTETLGIEIIPDCVREKLFYNKQFNKYIRVENPVRPLIVNPYITSSLIKACNAPPIKYKLTGKDAIRFSHLLDQNGELYLDGLDAGDYTFTLEAHSRMTGAILSLDLEVFVRDINFRSPFPYSIDLKTGYSSLLVYDSISITDLRVLDNSNGLIFEVN